MENTPGNTLYAHYTVSHPSASPVRHSGIGITSFVIALFAGLFMFLLIIMAGILEASSPGGIDEDSMQALTVGLLIFAAMSVDLVALVLGIIGLFQKDRKKLFPILGTVLAGASLVGITSLMILGLAMQ